MELCKEVNSWIGVCANDNFGCVKTNAKYCLRCNNLLDFNIWTECYDGFIKTVYGKCTKVN